MPENAISFEYNLKLTEDESLVNFIAKQTGKIKPLASADLDSYVILAKQFLNIGKPLTIEGIGTVQKSQQGDYEFLPGTFITPKIDDIPRQIREKRDESVSFESESKNQGSNKKLMAAFAILLIAVVGLSIYYLLFYKKDSAEQIAVTPPVTVAVPDTPKAATIDSAIINNKPLVDTNNFKVVIREFNSKELAEKSYTKLTSFGHKLSLSTSDSINYKLTMSFNRPLSDTLKVKDSLRGFFLGRPYIEIK